MLPLLLVLGLLYFAALAAGRLCARVQVPKVTGYLMVGLVAGPSTAQVFGFPEIISAAQVDSLHGLHEVTLGLIVLVIGGSFDFKALRRFGRRLLMISVAEILLTACLVGGGALLVGASPAVAAFLALMAITTAPAATQMVVREYEAEGPLTDRLMALIGLNNITAIVAFIVVFHSAVSPDASAYVMAEMLVLPLLIGVASGALLSLMDQRLPGQTERQLLALGTVAAIVGVSGYLGTSAMFATLIAGATLVNTSPNERRILEDLSQIDYPLYVLFFILAGAHLRIDMLPLMGAIGVAYIVARSLGKYLGCMLGSAWARSDPKIRSWLGPAMLAQAGLAIGLSQDLATHWGESGAQVQTAVLASVVVFEGVGPLLTRVSLVRSGEVTLLKLLSQRAPVSYRDGLHHIVEQFRDALGIRDSHEFKKPTDILVGHVMRRNIETVKEDVVFDDILLKLGQSRYDRLPVLDGDGHLVGVICYDDVSRVLTGIAEQSYAAFDRNAVTARHVAKKAHPLLTPEYTIEQAMEEVSFHPDHTYLLVVDDDDPKKLVGMVRHNDMLAAQHVVVDTKQPKTAAVVVEG